MIAAVFEDTLRVRRDHPGPSPRGGEEPVQVHVLAVIRSSGAWDIGSTGDRP